MIMSTSSIRGGVRIAIVIAVLLFVTLLQHHSVVATTISNNNKNDAKITNEQLNSDDGNEQRELFAILLNRTQPIILQTATVASPLLNRTQPILLPKVVVAAPLPKAPVPVPRRPTVPVPVPVAMKPIMLPTKPIMLPTKPIMLPTKPVAVPVKLPPTSIVTPVKVPVKVPVPVMAPVKVPAPVVVPVKVPVAVAVPVKVPIAVAVPVTPPVVVAPIVLPIHINCGYTTADWTDRVTGIKWLRDVYYSKDGSLAKVEDFCGGQDALYCSYRLGFDIHYQIPVLPTEARYKVTLHFIEPVTVTAMQRPMNISVANKVIVTQFDPFTQFGGKLKSGSVTFNSQKVTNYLNIHITSNRAINKGILNGIVIER